MDLQEFEYGGEDWMQLAEGIERWRALVCTGEFLDWLHRLVIFSKKIVLCGVSE
jgi:hypothetical protein